MSCEGVPPRQLEAFDIRVQAAALACDRFKQNPVEQTPRGDDTPNLVGSYTKGLPHDKNTGVIENTSDYDLFVTAVNTGSFSDIKAIPLGPQVTHENRFISGIAQGSVYGKVRMADVRAWESMAAGNAFDLQGPNSQDVAMPQHPALDSNELIAEMTEVYSMALIRDVPFNRFDRDSKVQQAVDDMNATAWVSDASNPPEYLTDEEKARLRGPFTPCTIFRGILPGDNVGPYISQFLLAGTSGVDRQEDESDGFISYGAHRIDQRVRVAEQNKDYMTTWASWLDVQNGADLRGRETYCRDAYRFIATPRDLATYVHFDALYQAYLNTCIILLGLKAPFDEGIPFQEDDDEDKQQGFALFGGPHILTLVTEVATRALKAVRFQKFNVHRRPRPEALGGLIERHYREPENELYQPVSTLYNGLDEDLLKRIARENLEQNSTIRDFGNLRLLDFDPSGETGKNLLLPMAFPEGSPMHPSYGAGHGTVAGACVTILKTWFNTDWVLPFAFRATDDGRRLVACNDIELTLEGELNKVCSNISIGRNWAGVHYFTDYIESIKLGEEIAIGILEEQMLTYQEKFSMTLKKFDGTTKVFSNE